MTMSKKKLVIADLFAHCQQCNDYVFDNELVKEISKRHGFGNPFDATKVDSTSVLPENVKAAQYCLVHLGNGRHQFVQAIDDCYHQFENIESETPWRYRQSALNEIDSSESNILSVGFNQRIFHEFLYDDITVNPKMYGARRTKINAAYRVGGETIRVHKLQMEMDMVTEHQGMVTVFEGKNIAHENFAVYQLFHPFVYFHQLQQNGTIEIDQINCCYLLRGTKNNTSVLRLYLYNFTDAGDISSIRLAKCTQYRLIQR